MERTGRDSALLETLGADGRRVFSEAPTERIDAPARRRRSSDSLARLRRLRAGGQPALALRDTLGVGGEGVVRDATQLALSRPVAVKTLRADRAGTEAEDRLLTEAQISGLLEHPNIVPIYDIQIDDDGALLIVFKKIDGESWVTGASLDADLEVLIKLCDAVAYAHDRGIVHRDLKPSNVLVGRFGEVYLTDWGIAGAIDDRHGADIPVLGDSDAIIGTPAYMAPEMLAPETGQIGPATDVYQLGAILYECLAGHPPHRGADIDRVVESILEGPPPLVGVEPRLAAICARAMARDPAARFAGALELQAALESVIRSAGARRLLERADRHLATLQTDAASGGDDEAGRMRLYRLLAECRFGFTEVAGDFPEAAAAGMRAAALAMIDYELARGAPEAAETVLAELDDPPASAIERIAEARDALRAADAQTRALAEEGRRHDPTRGHRTRKLFGLVVGVSVVFPPGGRVVAYLATGEHLTMTWALVSGVLCMLPVLAFGIHYRSEIHKSALTYAAAVAVLTGIVLSLIITVLTAALAWNPWLGRVIYMFTAGGIAATFTFTHVPKMLPCVVLFVICGVLISLNRYDIFYRDALTVLANGGLAVNALWLWWPRPPRAAISP